MINNMSIQEITQHTISYLTSFLNHSFPPTFRYFNNKSPHDIIKNHYKTLMYIENDIPLGYAHIDYDIVNDKYWFGLCVLPFHQGKGIGTQLIQKTLEYFQDVDFDSLHLTVDKINTTAYHLYTKFGFHIVRETPTIYIMQLTKSNILYLPVSFGEAIDKLTILDIKLTKIHDSRKVDVEQEYHQLSRVLQPILTRVFFLYNCLKQINLQIWENQDIFRDSSDDSLKNSLCKVIIEENDARFRIKNKINIIMNSFLKEQKGYEPNVYTIYYKDTGEHHYLDRVIMYQSIFHDKVHVYCSTEHEETLRHTFIHDPSIVILSQTATDVPTSYVHTYDYDIKNKLFFEYIDRMVDRTYSLNS